MLLRTLVSFSIPCILGPGRQKKMSKSLTIIDINVRASTPDFDKALDYFLFKALEIMNSLLTYI